MGAPAARAGVVELVAQGGQETLMVTREVAALVAPVGRGVMEGVEGVAVVAYQSVWPGLVKARRCWRTTCFRQRMWASPAAGPVLELSGSARGPLVLLSMFIQRLRDRRMQDWSCLV